MNDAVVCLLTVGAAVFAVMSAVMVGEKKARDLERKKERLRQLARGRYVA